MDTYYLIVYMGGTYRCNGDHLSALMAASELVSEHADELDVPYPELIPPPQILGPYPRTVLS